MFNRRDFAKMAGAAGIGAVGLDSLLVRKAFGLTPQGVPLPGNKIPQFMDPLPDLGTGLYATGATDITLTMKEFGSQVLPIGMPPTTVWGYRHDDMAATDSYINPVVIATRGTPTKIRFVNNLGFADPAVNVGSKIGAWVQSTDQTLHWANPNNLAMGNAQRLLNYSGPIPTVPHLHGGEVPPQLDGGPDAWFLSGTTTPGGYTHHGHSYYTSTVPGDTAALNEAIYRYPNLQEGANIWFHDHALGITRLNVYAGIAGAYIINEPLLWAPTGLKPPLIPLVIQDRMFDVAGQLFFPNVGINPEHPFWIPEFVGDTIVVNGKVWPFKAVTRQRYTLWFLNGSNARFYDMYLTDRVTGVKGPRMYVITTDGGSLENPVLIDPNATGRGAQKSLIVGPGERYEVIVDFNDPIWIANLTAAYGGVLPPTVNLHLSNNARTPFPNGAPAPKNTTGRLVEFRVNLAGGSTETGSFDPALALLAPLRTRPIIRLVDPVAGAPAVAPAVTRQLTLNEVMGPGGPLEVLVNNTKWSGESARTFDDFLPVSNGDVPETFTYYSEMPNEGDTELWEIINLTADAHPIHLHLVQFQLMNRQVFDVKGYNAAYNAAFGALGFNPAFGPPLKYTVVNADGAVGGNPAVSPFLAQKKGVQLTAPPLPNEAGWKDTVIMYPGEVSRIMVRWAPTDVLVGDTANHHFPFDPNGGHGYVWHCHIIDHEDNEMMRPKLVNPKDVARTYVQGTNY